MDTNVRTATVIAAGLALCLGAAAPVEARSSCGTETLVKRGETASRIAARCGIDERDLRDANPDVDWNRPPGGMRVAMPDERRPGPGQQPDAGRSYRVERGDTVESVARALGLSVDALLGGNPGLSDRDIVPGREIGPRGFQDRPGDFPPASRGGRIEMSLVDRQVQPGDTTTVDLEGLPPRFRVVLRAGPDGGRFFAEASGRADRGGSASIDISIPDRARPGDTWVVALIGPDRRPIATARLRIADGGGFGRPGRPPRGGSVVTGLLTREGIECPALRSDDGTLYTLSGPMRGFRAGDVVSVAGRPTDRSICQQGITIEIDEIERAAR